MLPKDDFDYFIEEAEDIVRKIENGEDVSILTEHLKLSASLIDPSTIPSTSFHSDEIAKVLEEFAKNSSPPPRQRREIKDSSSEICENVQNLHKNTCSPSNSSSSLRVAIFIILSALICFIYWLRLPPPCKHPIW